MTYEEFNRLCQKWNITDVPTMTKLKELIDKGFFFDEACLYVRHMKG